MHSAALPSNTPHTDTTPREPSRAAPPSSPPQPNTIAARVTADIIAALNHGVRPWRQPWDSATALALPLRHNSTPYRGGNILILWAAAAARGYTARYWLTFKQAQALGGAVRRGERATHILFYKDLASAPASSADTPAPSSTDTDTPARRAVLRSHAVFSANQIDNLPPHFFTPAPPPADNTFLATRLYPAFDRVPAVVQHGGARACYNPATDTIHLPPRHSFISDALYFSTRLHECGHWSGHPTRLARDAFLHPGPRAATAYAREELVAELTAAFLGAELGLPVDHLEDHASYLDYWLKLLDRDPGALLAAAAHAQRAVDFLRPFLFGDAVTIDTQDAADTPAART